MSKLHSVEKIGLVRHDKIGCTSEEYFKSLCPWDCKAGLEVQMIHVLLQCIYCFALFPACNQSARTWVALPFFFLRQYFRKQPIGRKKKKTKRNKPKNNPVVQPYSGLGEESAWIKHDTWAVVCVPVWTVLPNPTNTLSVIHLVRTICEPWIATG